MTRYSFQDLNSRSLSIEGYMMKKKINTPRAMKPKEIENTTWIQDFPRRISVIGTAMDKETSDCIDDEVDCIYLSESGSNTINTCNSAIIAPVELKMMTMLNRNLLNTIFKFNPFSKLKRFLVKRTGMDKTYYSLAETLLF